MCTIHIHNIVTAHYIEVTNLYIMCMEYLRVYKQYELTRVCSSCTREIIIGIGNNEIHYESYSSVIIIKAMLRL